MAGPTISAMFSVPPNSPYTCTRLLSSVMSPMMLCRMGRLPDSEPAMPRMRSAQGYDLESPRRKVESATPVRHVRMMGFRPTRSEEYVDERMKSEKRF